MEAPPPLCQFGIDDIEDDLGVRYGKATLEFGACARNAVRPWKVDAVGNRPADWITRDLLFSPGNWDKRLWMFRSLSGDKAPTWIREGTSRWAPRLQKVVRKVRAFHFIHAHHTLQMRQHAIGNENIQAADQLEAVLRCWPQGVQVSWQGDGRRSERDVCQRSWLCPFCYARNIGKLYQRLNQVLSLGDPSRYLLFVTVQCAEEELSGLWEDGQGTENFTPDERLTQTILEARTQLVDRLRDVGCRGGLVASQLVPLHTQERYWLDHESVDHEISELGIRLAAIAEVSPGDYRGDDSVRIPDVQVRSLRLTPTTALRRCTRQDLRVLMSGHGRSYTAEIALKDGYGVFGWPAICFSTYTQWERRRRLTANRHLFDLWGTWRSVRTEPGQPLLHFERRPPRAVRRQSPLNERRHTERLQGLETLVSAVHPVWTSLTEENAGPPGRVQFARALQQQGVRASERQIRALVERFRNEDQGRRGGPDVEI